MKFASQYLSIAARVCTLLAIAGLSLNAGAAHAQYTDLHDFGDPVTLSNGTTGQDGIGPGEQEANAAVTVDSAGNVYGTAGGGGLYGNGIVWEITNTGVYKDLHDFGGTVINADGLAGPDGFGPTGTVAFDSAGNMYGTTPFGGPYYYQSRNGEGDNSGGMLWELTAASGYTTYIDLHDFGGQTTLTNGTVGEDGQSPTSVSVDPNGNLFGTTSIGGLYPEPVYGYYNVGIIWELSNGGVYTDLHDFGGPITFTTGQTGTDGWLIATGVTIDSAGNLYGTTQDGGAAANYWAGGIAYELTAASGYTTYIDRHDFGLTVTEANGQSGPDGNTPFAPVTIDSAGNLYGTTEFGGPDANGANDGILWEINAAGTYIDRHDFGALYTFDSSDGAFPQGQVAVDANGDVFGTTYNGGLPIPGPYGSTSYAGVAWEWRSDGSYYILHNFGFPITSSYGTTAPDGSIPTGVALDSVGNIYGAAFYGGANNNGVLTYGMAWKLDVPSTTPPVTPVISPTAAEYVTSVAVSITDATPGAVIFYTTDGSTPTPGSGTTQTYTGSFNITVDATVQAVAESAGGGVSPVASASYLVRAANPTFSNNGQHLSSAINLTMADATPNASIYYTLDGSAPDPGAADTFHYHGVPVVVEPGDTVEAIATLARGQRSGTKIANFPAIPPPAAPTFNAPAGSYVTSATVVISDATAAVDIYYTTDGSTPAPGIGTTQLYTGPLTITANTTVKAIAAYTSGAGAGPVATAVYAIHAADPVITPGSETITGTITVTMSDVTPNASIYYSLDGSAPSPGAADTFHWHGVPVQVASGTTVTAIATLLNADRSNTVVDTYP